MSNLSDYAMDVEDEDAKPLAETSSFASSSTNYESPAYFFQDTSSTSLSGPPALERQESKHSACKCGGLKQTYEQSVEKSNVEDSIGHKKKKKLETLGSELICPICHDLFMEAATIECGHSFCRTCIDEWLKKIKFNCPECRQPVHKPPINSVCLDKAVCAVLESAQEKEILREMTERKKEVAKLRESECFAQTCLETLFQKAVQQGVKVVHISKQWSPREQQRFLGGIERHQGVAREAYCKVVGLTYEWVGRATKEELVVAAANVRLKDMEHQPRTTDDWKEACTRKLRERLEMYIRYG